MDKKVVMIGMVIGSTIGGWLPTLFGVGVFSMISVLGGFAGGVLGIWLSYKFLN
jgi:outer membrane lipoprotein SlyB